MTRTSRADGSPFNSDVAGRMAMERKEYWNKEYFEYWKKRVDEANAPTGSESKIVPGDKINTSDQNYFSAIDLLNINAGASLLEMGCGFGRSIPHLYRYTHNILAIDISAEMVDNARQLCSQYKGVQFRVADAEYFDCPSDSFEYVVCFAVFDALFQRDAILKMNVLLKPHGKVLLTGKNDDYFEDDNEALTAEANARVKGHPNFFTDVRSLLDNLHLLGFELIRARYFLRRGDFNLDKYVTRYPDRFYEYLLVCEKIGAADPLIDVNLSSDVSKTYRRLKRNSLLSVPLGTNSGKPPG